MTAAYTQLEFKNISVTQSEILIAALSDAGFEGFEEGEQFLKAFILSANYDPKAVHKIIAPFSVEYSETIIQPGNWNELWESNFQPVIVDDFAGIRAHFHEPLKNVQYEIIITPKMSFGTGHHATTMMMIRQMRKIDFAGKKVFDFGTGTGILSILAEKLGAQTITAVDNDDWSIENARENLERNHCSAVQLYKSDSLPVGSFDIILANINKNVILDHFSSLVKSLGPAGVLLLSGLLNQDEADIIEKARQYSLQITNKQLDNNWICLELSC